MEQVIDELNFLQVQEKPDFGQQHILQKGLKLFCSRGREAAGKELKQLHDRVCFQPILVSELSPSEKKKAQDALMFLTEKQDKSIKGRMVYNGKPTRNWLSREDSASPTAALESILLTAIIDAHENRDVMTADAPNAFIQTEMLKPKPGKDRVIMKIAGMLVDLLVELAPDVYGSFVILKNGKRMLYVRVLRALCSMLIVALLWHNQFCSDLENIGFAFNPYHPCVANKKVHGKQQTVVFHVDNLKSSHVNPKVNNKFLSWLNKKHGNRTEVKATRGKVPDYLGMTFDYSEKGKVKVTTADYMKAMVDNFPYKDEMKVAASNATPANLFGNNSEELLDAI